MSTDKLSIKLSKISFFHAAQIGLTRQYTNLIKGRKDAHGCKEVVGWNIHIEGACGESGVAKNFNIYWDGNMGHLEAEDVNSKIIPLEVRTTSRHTNRLLVHKKDKDDHGYILVTGIAPDLYMRGWMWGKEAKQEKYWTDPNTGRPAYFIPVSNLRPMEELKAIMKIK